MAVSPKVFWQSVLDELVLVLDKSAISTWLAQTSLQEITNKKVVISCSSPYAKSIIRARYQNEIKSILQKRLGRSLQIAFTTSQPLGNSVSGPLFEFDQLPKEVTKSASPGKDVPSKPETTSGTNLDYRFNFENFVIGNSNRVAHSAALAVSEKPGLLYNPLFIHGGTGVGKTHLLHAIGNKLVSRSQLKVIYFPAEQFLNEFITHIRLQKNMNDFKEKYRSQEAILVDDFQFMGGKEGTQEEFFHTFNYLQGKKKQIVIAADKLPKDIANLTQRLISRFDGGLVVDIASPDFETRLAILQTKSDELKLDLNSKALAMMAEKLTSNVRELEGALLKVKAQVVAQKQPVSLGLINEILEGETKKSALGQRLTPEVVLNLITQTFDTTITELCGKKRKREIVVPRQIAMFLLRNEIGLNFSEIGEILGGRDHTTVMHGCEKVSKELQGDDRFLRAAVKEIRSKLYPTDI